MKKRYQYIKTIPNYKPYDLISFKICKAKIDWKE